MKNFHHKATISVLGFAALFLMTVGLVTHSGTKESAVVASPASSSYSYDRTDQRRAASFSKENQVLQKRSPTCKSRLKKPRKNLATTASNRQPPASNPAKPALI